MKGGMMRGRLLGAIAVLVATVAGATTTTTTTIPPQRDQFERATLGANWTAVRSNAAGTIAGSTDFASGFPGRLASSFWNAATAPATGYACARLGGTAAYYAGACLAASHGGGVCCEAAGAEGWRLRAMAPPFVRTTPASGVTPVFAVGDYIGIQRTGARAFECFRSTNGTTWTGLGAVTVPYSPPAAGSFGASAAGDGAVGFTLTQWEGGAGALPSGSACGATTTTTTSSTSSTSSSTTTTTTTSSTTTT